ncbi:MAG: general secretion pathway protein GspB [Woeseiaceae bacterium]|nr:general secretion pathway protein GspB [Woeseiaceae bacterium]
MSYILDALKKSESERQQRHAPGVASVPDRARRRAAPAWTWVLAGLLLVNAAAIGFLVLRPAALPVPVAATMPPPAVVPSPATGAEPTLNDIASEARISRPAPPAGDDSRASADEVAPPPAAQNEPADERTGQATAPAPRSAPQAAAQPAATPGYLELKARGVLQVPDLHLDIHVFSPEAGERFVFINMQKYREGDRLAEGPEVTAIRDDGVLLEHRGTAFLLPRE